MTTRRSTTSEVLGGRQPTSAEVVRGQSFDLDGVLQGAVEDGPFAADGGRCGRRAVECAPSARRVLGADGGAWSVRLTGRECRCQPADRPARSPRVVSRSRAAGGRRYCRRAMRSRDRIGCVRRPLVTSAAVTVASASVRLSRDLGRGVRPFHVDVADGRTPATSAGRRSGSWTAAGRWSDRTARLAARPAADRPGTTRRVPWCGGYVIVACRRRPSGLRRPPTLRRSLAPHIPEADVGGVVTRCVLGGGAARRADRCARCAVHRWGA